MFAFFFNKKMDAAGKAIRAVVMPKMIWDIPTIF
jgi:hypothetical protein